MSEARTALVEAIQAVIAAERWSRMANPKPLVNAIFHMDGRLQRFLAAPAPPAPPQARLLFNEDGETIDEIVSGGFMHLEQMGPESYYLGVGNSQFSLVARKSKLIVTGYTIEDEDFPRQERHKTAAEVKQTGFDPAYITLKGDAATHKQADDDEAAAAIARAYAGEGEGE